MLDNTDVNLLHLELFDHFQRDTVGTLAFPEIWQRILPWSFQVRTKFLSVALLFSDHIQFLPGRRKLRIGVTLT